MIVITLVALEPGVIFPKLRIPWVRSKPGFSPAVNFVGIVSLWSGAVRIRARIRVIVIAVVRILILFFIDYGWGLVFIRLIEWMGINFFLEGVGHELHEFFWGGKFGVCVFYTTGQGRGILATD